MDNGNTVEQPPRVAVVSGNGKGPRRLHNRAGERTPHPDDTEYWVERVIAEYQERRTHGLRGHTDAVRETVAAARSWCVRVSGKVPQAG